ncbi:DUF5677 domain-containing protein [Klebsiella quasipneumoniae subsp. similipneumoniae]
MVGLLIFSKPYKSRIWSNWKDVNLEHMRPYYKWASQNIHTGSKAMRNRLGLCETNEDILLVGQSNSGMTDQHATAINLVQVTVSLLFLKPNID